MTNGFRLIAVVAAICSTSVMAHADGMRLIGCDGRLASSSTDEAAATRICPWPARTGDVTLVCDPTAGNPERAVGPLAEPKTPTTERYEALRAGRVEGGRLIDFAGWQKTGRVDCAFETFRAARAD